MALTDSQKAKRYRARHPDRIRAYSKKNHRNARLKHKYGITEAKFEAQIEAQGGLCPVGLHPFGQHGSGGDSPCQDHDHKTGQNRAVLCRNHNVGLGLFNDSTAELQSGIMYLNRFRS